MSLFSANRKIKTVAFIILGLGIVLIAIGAAKQFSSLSDVYGLASPNCATQAANCSLHPVKDFQSIRRGKELILIGLVAIVMATLTLARAEHRPSKKY